MEAIASLEAAKLQPAVEAAKIEDLKKSIPRIDEYREVLGERVLSGSKGLPDPMSLLPSDGAMDYKRDTLLEKARKVITKQK